MYKRQELVIASVHRGPGKMETDREDSAANTQMYMKVLGDVYKRQQLNIGNGLQKTSWRLIF